MERTIYNKDIQILRQSQIKLALEYCNSIGVQLSIAELQRMTEVLVECCLFAMDKDLKERVKKLDEFLQTKKNDERGS